MCIGLTPLRLHGHSFCLGISHEIASALKKQFDSEKRKEEALSHSAHFIPSVHLQHPSPH